MCLKIRQVLEEDMANNRRQFAEILEAFKRNETELTTQRLERLETRANERNS